MTDRPRYHADDCSRDVLALDPRTIEIEDARSRARPHSLAQAGFALLAHKSAVSDFRNPEEIARTYRLEIERLPLELTDADKVVLNALPVRRFAAVAPDSIRLTNSGQIYNSRPGYFVHVDISNAAAAAFATLAAKKIMTNPCAVSPTTTSGVYSRCHRRTCHWQSVTRAVYRHQILSKPTP